eukprot:1687457-Pyramimonas_sp.AAC.1
MPFGVIRSADWLQPRAYALWCDPIGRSPEQMPFGAIRSADWSQPRAYALWCDPIGPILVTAPSICPLVRSDWRCIGYSPEHMPFGAIRLAAY